MTITKSVDPEAIRVFDLVSDFVADTIIDAPEFATVEDCVDFVYDNIAEDELSSADHAAISSPAGVALLSAYAKFITVAS